MPQTVVNYYEILDVAPRSTHEEIRTSFRRKVMEHHPDRNPRQREAAEEKVRIIIEAYRVLSDPDEREKHDAQLQPGLEADYETVWDRLRRQTADPAARSRLVLHELLEGNGAIAVEIYESLLREYVRFDLLPYLSLKDYLDCKFLLAEAYERQGKDRIAIEMYKEVYREELELPRLCFFFEEVQIRLRDLYCKTFARYLPPDEALNYYREALELLRLDKADRALIYKRMAECHHKLDDLDSAREAICNALRQKPNLKGCKRICEKLGISPLC